MRSLLFALIGMFGICGAWAAAVGDPQPPRAADDRIMYVGTYTRAPSKGIYAYRLNAAGELTPMGTAGLVAETENPSFLAVHPNQRFLYAVNELDRDAGSVSAFSIDRSTGTLTLLNRVSSRGGSPCHVSIDRSGKVLFVANYGGGSVAGFRILDDGKLAESSWFFQGSGSSVNKQRQSGPHAHAVVVSPDNRFLLTADLGLDRLFSYPLDPSGTRIMGDEMGTTSIAPGSGPRHLAFRPDGKFVYVLTEMVSNVVAFSYDAARGRLTELQTLSTLPEGFSGENSGAEIIAHPNSRFLYASNRGHDSIAAFRIDETTGKLTALDRVPTQGKTPRGFEIDPSGRFLIAGNQNSGTVVVFRIDQNSGALTPTGTTIQVPFPVSVAFANPR